MAQVVVYGRAKSVTNREIKLASEFSLDLLLGPRLSPTVSVDIILDRNISREDSIEGEAEWIDNHIRPRDFQVRLNANLGRVNLLKLLFHELVHVKQFAKCELVDLLKTAMKKWKGVYYDDENMEYWDQPWEIEAYGMEPGLFYKYNRFLMQRNGKKT